MSPKKKIKIELTSVPLFSYDEICKNKVVKQGPTDHNTALKTEKERIAEKTVGEKLKKKKEGQPERIGEDSKKSNVYVFWFKLPRG